MKKIVIADDDAAMRISLKTMLDFELYGYRIAGEAADGREALMLCIREKPDIVITDMKMPGTDGISFLKALRAEGLNPYIIALSGYDDFSLVRDAMKLGASDYILKLELTREKLLEVLAAARGSDPDDQQEEEGSGEIGRDLLRQHLLREVICHFYEDPDELSRRMEENGIRFHAGIVYCMLIKAGELYRFEDADDEEVHTLQYAIRNVTEDILHDCMESFYASGKTGELFVFACLKDEYAEMPELPYRLAGRVKDMLYQFLDITSTICICEGGNRPDDLYGSARKVQELMKQRKKVPVTSPLFGEVTGTSKSVVESACRMLEESYAEDLSLPLVADRLGLSPGYLSAMMKKQTGRGFTDYLNGVRMKHAKKLLEETNETLHAIASECGYSDQYYFSRLFKKITGVSPGSWRRGERVEGRP